MMRILLLQAREPGDPMAGAERRSFAARAGLPVDAFVPHDLLAGPPDLGEALAYDALMVGGSGDYYVSNGNLPFLDDTLDFVRRLVDTGHPTFASCFGFHLLVRALGGTIVHDRDRTEVGTFDVTLTDDGIADPLFRGLPRRFPAQVGRKDRAERLPEGTVHLAGSDRCPYHALRVPDRPIWATRFHPELTARENRDRFLHYLEGYGAHLSVEEQRAVLQRFRESRETRSMIPRFLELLPNRNARLRPAAG